MGMRFPIGMGIDDKIGNGKQPAWEWEWPLFPWE